ncbi:MAG: MoaF-related domain-containing protein [Omnitrophica WOR_2 bacterium]
MQPTSTQGIISAMWITSQWDKERKDIYGNVFEFPCARNESLSESQDRRRIKEMPNVDNIHYSPSCGDEDQFPGVGHVYEVDFSVFRANLYFESETKMTYTRPDGGSQTVKTTVTKIRPGVYMVYWQEADKSTVVHVEDYENGIVYTNITQNDMQFDNLKGTLKKLK